MKNHTYKRILLVILAGAMLASMAGCSYAYTTSGTADSGTATAPSVPTTGGAADGALDLSFKYYADIEIKDYGKITVLLEPDDAPLTCANFVKLAESGFYNGLTFHRIKEDFIMQGGDPEGNGFGGSDETIVGEFAANGYPNTLSHTRGAISMARNENFNSASSQFFIVHNDSTFLDGGYAAFGYVTEGMDVVDAVCTAARPIDGNGSIARDSQPVMTSVIIRREKAE